MKAMFNVKFYWFFCLILLLNSAKFYGQNTIKTNSNKKAFSERLYFGGALGLSFGSYSSLVDVSPTIGYAVTDDFIAGIGITYKHYRLKDYYFNTVDKTISDSRTNIYGGSIWARYFLTKTEIPIIENIFLHGEIEPLTFVNQYKFSPGGNIQDPYGNRYIEEKEHINITGVFLGGGLRQLISRRSYLYIEVLWDFNEGLYSPYSNPRIRIGFAAGF